MAWLKENGNLPRINTLDAQPYLHVDDKLDILQQLWNSTSSSQGKNEEESFIAKLLFSETILARNERRGLNSSKHSSSRKESPRVPNNREAKFNQLKPKRLAYVAQDVDSEVSELSEHSSCTESEIEEIEEDGMMAFSEDSARGKRENPLLLPTLHTDTAASSHMTNNPKNFKGPLRPTRRTIKVGGGKLFCLEMGDANPNQMLGNISINLENERAIWSRKEMIHKNRIDKFKLMHQRLGHVGSAALSKVHNVTTLTKPILIPQMLPEYDISLGVNIAGPFSVSVRGNSYFAEIVDNWSRKVWILVLTHRSDLAKKLYGLSIILEKQSGETILAGRSDGAAEILKLFGEWKLKRGIRAIQTSENEARVLLEDSKMPVEFWDYAVESGAYVRNRLQRGPWIEKDIEGAIVHQQLSPEGAWSETIGNVEHLVSNPSEESLINENNKTESKPSSASITNNLPIDTTKQSVIVTPNNLPNTSSKVVSPKNNLTKHLVKVSEDLNPYLELVTKKFVRKLGLGDYRYNDQK
ncbi:hypothetical protein EPUL_003992 [Erysiphe pulchra]|uniref:Integrase catalytic domain-containing protein n=1 Tax=Erysiphe pulchra TaxID=225359 RepID=A0A2S4PT17_9PEZI|nr:hypothetical protein EPUL_003992 [Erysiphe pulchra]